MIVLWITEYSNIDCHQQELAQKAEQNLVMWWGEVEVEGGSASDQNIQEMTPELRSDGKEGHPEATGAIPEVGQFVGVPQNDHWRCDQLDWSS